MKKFSIYLLGALAMAFSACEDAPETPPMQANPQEPVLEGTNVNVAPTGLLSDNTQTIALESYRNSELVEILAEGEMTDIPAGATTSYVFELAKDENFTSAEQLDVTVQDGKGYVSPESWNAAHIQLFGKSPKPKDAFYRVEAYANVNGASYRVGGTDYYVAQGTVKETCMDQGFVIYPNYYFIGNLNNWALNTDYQFTHSDADVYDDPVFTITVDIPEGINDGNGCYWKIASQKAVDENNWDYVYGPATDGSEDAEGMLLEGGAAQAGKIAEAGKYMVTINMETMEYSIVRFTRPEYLCTPNKANGWNQMNSNWMRYIETDKGNYFYGAVVINPGDGGFKLTDGNTWDNDKTWGYGGTVGQLGLGAPDNIPVDATGLYWLKADLEALTYEAIPVESMGVIGGGDWNSQRNLTPNADFTIWEGDADINGTWKIRINDNWDYNFGGDLADPALNGSDFPAGAGMNHVVVDLTGNWPVISVTPL